MAQKRKDTKLQSIGAEFLVLGNLLLRNISTYKSYQNFPGYDLIAVNPNKNLSARIQVKSRYRTDWDGFIIKNYDCDFVIFATLNRGYAKPKKNGDQGLKAPDYYIFPISYVKKIMNPSNKWGKITKSKMIKYEKYKEAWPSINRFLKI